MNFKFGFYQLISLVFLIIGLVIMAFTIRIGFESYQKFLLVDESGVISSGVFLQEGNLKSAIEILNESKELEIELVELDKNNDDGEGIDRLMPNRVEIEYEQGVDQDFIDQVVELFEGQTVEINRVVRDEIEESQVIYKENYNELKDELLKIFKSQDRQVKILRRKEDREIDISIKIKI